jgi:hypothetical protein
VPTYQIRRSTVLLAAALAVGLIFSNATLFSQNRRLKSRDGALPASIVPTVGASLPPLVGVDLQGKKLDLSYGGDPRKTILLVFSPSCGVCTINWPVWESLAKEADPGLYRIVYASTTSGVTSDYTSLYGISNSLVFSRLDPKSQIAYKLQFTPETILIGADGNIERVWLGLIDGAQLEDIQRTIGVRLQSVASNRNY